MLTCVGGSSPELMVAGVPNRLIACWSATTVFSEVVWLNRPTLVTHLEASSKNMMR